MPSTVESRDRLSADTIRCPLPAHMRVLFITTQHRTGGWLAEAFAADSAAQVVVEEARGTTAGLARLREEVFDAVLLAHHPGELDALEFLEALRAAGSEEPVIVLGVASEQELSALCLEATAEAYLCVNTTTTRTLLWVMARAMERHRLLRENRRLTLAEHQRLQRERDEAQRLLEEQQTVVGQSGHLRRYLQGVPTRRGTADASPRAALPLPEPLLAHYRDLLRSHVIMGSGTLSSEVHALARVLAQAGFSAQQTAQLHLQVVAELLRGLGNRSGRHLIARADLLIIEVLLHLAENYRERYREVVSPPRQRLLPGME
jgi:DNA-binding response OmpR family regulator